MFLQVKQVTLWPRNTELAPRTLTFEAGMVNVISGASKTGKSALIPIIDYCLGSDRCAIPVNTIRDHCAWFGILVQTDEGQKLLARRNPGNQQSTGDMFVIEEDVVRVPREIEGANTTLDAVKKRLDELAGLSNLGLDPTAVQGQTVRGSRPSFRDLMAFCFQPQNVVANQDLLFFKADTYEHREKLKAIFPYVLGALTPEVLALRWELESLRRDLTRKERELTAMSQASVRWTAELKTWVARAREYGLTAAEPSEETDSMLSTLREVVKQSSRNAAITPDSINTSVAELVMLEREESVIAAELGALRRRHTEMARLRDTAQDYLTALKTQRERLSIATWLRTQVSEDASCPICHEPMHQPTAELEGLCQAIDTVEQQSQQFKPAPDAFEKEFHNTRELIRSATERLTAVRGRKDALAAKSEDVRRALYKAMEIDRFLGRLDQSLSTYDGMAPGNDLVAEVAELRERVKALQAKVAELEVRKREQAALAKVSTFAGRLIPKLDAERPNDAISLSIADLAVKVRGSDGRDDYLFEIGSGANWLSYHVAVTLALQQLFISQSDNPVPGFLVYDQPSQVYFPRRLAPRRDGATDDVDPKLLDEDVAAVRRVFEVVGEVVTAAKGKLQVIVLDHADETVWGELKNVALVEKWREGTKLVPMSWIES